MKRPIILVGAALVLLLVSGGIWRGLPRYRQYKQTRGMRQARGFLAKGDLSNASVSARQVLQTNPRNVEACLLMAEMAETVHSPAAIDWRRRLLEIDPSMENRFALIACALRFEHPPYLLAAQALKELGPAAAKVPAFHSLSAELDLKSNRFEDAAAHFRAAAQLEPKNLLHQLNLAVVELRSTNLVVARAARGELERLSHQTNLTALALRSLAADALRRDELTKAKLVSDRLVGLPAPVLDDWLLHLTIVQRIAGSADVSLPNSSNQVLPQWKEFSACLSSLQADVTNNGVEIFAVCDWMGSHGLADAGLKWLAQLDSTLLKSVVLRLAKANLQLAKGDWAGMEKSLASDKWGDLEFLRQALLARAACGNGQPSLGEARWSGAVRGAAGRLGSLMLLWGLAQEWQLNPEEVLWQISLRFPREQWALRSLERLYLSSDNTAGLNKVYGRLIEETGPDDVTNQNDFACTSLLLGINLPQAHSMARRLFLTHPQDVVLASTYAYSLGLQGKASEGAEVLSRFKEQDLKQPPIALYYGLLLAKTGRPNQAVLYLQLAERIRLSPEEKRLLDAAMRQQSGN